MGAGGLRWPLVILALLGGAFASGGAPEGEAAGGGEPMTALVEGLQALSPAERESFWAKLRRNHNAVRRPAETPAAPRRRRRRAQDDVALGRCLGRPLPPSIRDNVTDSDLQLTVEVDDGSDLNILSSHVAKVLLEEVIGFKVSIYSARDAAGSMYRLALEKDGPNDGCRLDDCTPVDVNMGVMAESKLDVETYDQLVEDENLVMDLGATGYSVQAGWFVRDREAVRPRPRPRPAARPRPPHQLDGAPLPPSLLFSCAFPSGMDPVGGSGAGGAPQRTLVPPQTPTPPYIRC